MPARRRERFSSSLALLPHRFERGNACFLRDRAVYFVLAALDVAEAIRELKDEVAELRGANSER
jgi:hypothetical protein